MTFSRRLREVLYIMRAHHDEPARPRRGIFTGSQETLRGVELSELRERVVLHTRDRPAGLSGYKEGREYTSMEQQARRDGTP